MRISTRVCLGIFLMFFSITLLPKTTIFFSPDDNPRRELISLIDNAQQTIIAAVYLITDNDITRALIAAKKRGVEVEVVTDAACRKMPVGKLPRLIREDIPVHIYDPGALPKGTQYGIMHDKFTIFDEDILWTGSFNWTYSASVRNQENAMLIEDEPDLVERYAQRFEVLKTRCHGTMEHKGIAAMHKETIATSLAGLWEEARSMVSQLFGGVVSSGIEDL